MTRGGKAKGKCSPIEAFGNLRKETACHILPCGHDKERTLFGTVLPLLQEFVNSTGLQAGQGGRPVPARRKQIHSLNNTGREVHVVENIFMYRSNRTTSIIIVGRYNFPLVQVQDFWVCGWGSRQIYYPFIFSIQVT